MVFKSSAWLWLWLAAPWHQNGSCLFGDPKGWSPWHTERRKIQLQMSSGGGRAGYRRFSSLPVLAAKYSPWLSAWPAHELLLAHFPALFLVSFQQDELRLRTVDGQAPVAVLEPGPTPLATFCRQTVSRLWLKHREKKPNPTSPCVSGFHLQLSSLQFLILI